MMNAGDIAFPHLGIYLENVPRSFSVFGFEIAFYGLIIGIGVLAGILMAVHQAKVTGENPDTIWDFAIYAVIFSVIGARIYYVIFAWDYYKDNLLSIFNTRNGGMAIYGGVIGAFLTLFLYCKIKKINPFRLGDLCVPGLILGQIIGVGVIALIVVFQQEIRRFLLLLGTQYSHRKNTLFGRWFKSRQSIDRALEWIDPIVNACADMAASKTGALIVIGRSISLDPLIERGEPIDARVSSALIKTIFFKNSPLHDGAIVIANGRIAAARCVLPSTEREVVPSEFGMRHRAALGASEVTDALVIAVSEERGTISVARKGHIRQNLTPIQLHAHLSKVLSLS